MRPDDGTLDAVDEFLCDAAYLLSRGFVLNEHFDAMNAREFAVEVFEIELAAMEKK